jgi:O-methyltransferase
MAWKNDQVTKEETDKIIEIARKVLSVPGDYVEMGCYKGDTSLVLADILRNHQNESCEKLVENFDGQAKKLWIYDSFEGLPEKSKEDASALGVDFKGGELFVTKREVKERFLRAGLPVPVIKKAWFSNLTEVDLPEKISFAFLDGDFYESIRDSLKLVESKMGDGGIVIVHDYANPQLPGVAKAVDEWLAKRRLKTYMYKSMIIIYF